MLYGVTIQLTPLLNQQYFCMVPFVYQYFTKLNLGFFLGVKGQMKDERVNMKPKTGLNHFYFINPQRR